MGKMGSYISVELTLFILYCLFPCHENNHWKNEKLVWSKPPHMLMEDSIFFFLFFFYSTQILTSVKTKMADVLTSALTHKVVTYVTAEMDT